MSAYGMTPLFKDRIGYLKWRAQWKQIYHRLSSDLRASKWRLRTMQQTGHDGAETAKFHKELGQRRAMAWKMMTLRAEARLRRDKIIAMTRELREAKAQYPLEIKDCRNIDFHFNKGHLQFSFIPAWVVKTKGKTFYVEHVTATVPWSTKETPDNPHTKGAIRLRNCTLSIDEAGMAIIH